MRVTDRSQAKLTHSPRGTILNTIDAEGGSTPERLERVYSAVEAAWFDLHGRRATSVARASRYSAGRFPASAPCCASNTRRRHRAFPRARQLHIKREIATAAEYQLLHR